MEVLESFSSVLFIAQLVLLGTAHSRSSSEGPASQLVVLNDLPKEFDNVLQSGNHKMIVRTNFKGSVEFIESERFHIDINITSPNVDELAKIQYDYTNYDGAILLQMYESLTEPVASPVPLIFLAIGGATIIALVGSTMFVCWWNSAKKDMINSKKMHSLDSSQEAPLLEGRSCHDGPDNQNRRKKKHRPHHKSSTISGDEYASSEEEILREKMMMMKNTDTMSSRDSRYAYPPTTKVRTLRGQGGRHGGQGEPPLVSSDGESNTPTPHNMSIEDPQHLPPPPPPPPGAAGGDRPVVSYIKLQPDVAMKQQRPGGDYSTYQKPDDPDDGGFSDFENQTTLKARCEDGIHCERTGDPTIPDVIRGQPANRQSSLDRNPSRESDYEHPLYSQVNKPRYNTAPAIKSGPQKPSNMTSSQPPLPPPPESPNHYLGEGEDTLGRLYSPASKESDYSTINRQQPPPLSGAQIAQILTDKNRASPKYSHNTNRPPTTFSRLPPNRDANLEQVDLDSVGSSRSGESSKSSGMRTQSSFTDSTYGSDKRAPVFTDSDSAHSTSSSANRSRDSGLHGGIRYYVKHPSEENEREDHFPSPSASDPSSTSSSSPRLVDEAYGTMVGSVGSQNGSINGNNTLRSSSASTGSGSSGSVVTVINNPNEDPAGVGSRKRVYFKTRQSPSHVNGNGSLERKTGGGGGGGGGNIPHHYVHSTIICCLSLLCVTSAVYLESNRVRETSVSIKIYAPYGYLKSVPVVFTRKDKDVTVAFNYQLQVMSIMQFEVDDAHLKDLNSNLCMDANHCSGAKSHCDPSTGRCVCKKGYFERKTVNGDSVCEDIDECNNDLDECDINSKCENYNGYYNCVCSPGHYGDGKSCQSCSANCIPGTFEVMGCMPPNKQKVCQECSRACMSGYFIQRNCTSKANTVCKACSARCERKTFEYTPCDNEGLQDRQCRGIDSLPKPSGSDNLIYENRKSTIPILTHILHQDADDSILTHVKSETRGDDLTLTINLRDSNLAPLFRAVNHDDSNDNDGFWGDLAIQRDYCPYPVPEKYTLSLVMHQDVTTKAQFYDCQKHAAVGEKCESETGYYLNPNEACESYSQFGRLPVLNSEGWSIICTKAAGLTELFNVDSELEDVSTMFVDKTVKCAEHRTNCDSCSVRCAREMQSYRGSNRCNITGEDSDNGESPRLAYCYACCNKQDCSKMCEVYHDPECDRTRCVTGNVAEFVLQPIWHHSQTIFACHIEPVPDYTIYDIEYEVKYKGKTVNNRKLHAKKTFQGKHPDRALEIHNFLRVYFGSDVIGSPNLLEGDTSRNEYNVGYYQAKGERLGESRFPARNVNVRPKVPFHVSTKLWKEADCNTDLLDDLMVTDLDGSPDNDPYKQQVDLKVQYAARGAYKVFNASQSYSPFIYFEVPQEVSILSSLYDPTTVRDDSTLQAEIQRNSRRWILMIRGELNMCPGYFNVKVLDPQYPSEHLFHYDVGVDCPKAFSISFTIPTEGDDTYQKRLLVEITDSYRTIKMTVVRPRPQVDKETKDFFWSNQTDNSYVNYGNKGEVKMTVFTPITAVLGVIISSLMLLLCVGVLTDTGKPKRKSDNKVQGQHLVFVVGYVTFRTAYSIAVTFTVLLLIIRHINRGPISTLVEFGRYAETGENSQDQEIESIQNYVLGELQRQNQAANQTKLICERKLQQLQATLEKSKDELVIANNEDKLISQVALEYTKIMIQNLTDDVNKFKVNFAQYASKSMDKLTRNIVQTSSALQGSKWLAGAKLIYDTVTNKRRAQGQSTKPFLDWLGLQQEIEQLSSELSLQDFPMPSVDDFLNMEKPNVNFQPSPLPKIQDITLPKNQWYFHQTNKAGGVKDSGSTKSGANHRPGNEANSGSFKGRDVISWSTFFVVLVIIDSIWFIHRMAKTYSTAKMMLYGCPTFIDCKKAGPNSLDESHITKPVTSRCFHFIKDLNLRIMKTEFVPKLVATVTTCCALYFILGVSDKLITVRALASVGYIESLVAPVETTYQLAKTRTKTNAYRINKFEYPFYEELVNMRTKRYQLMLNMYAEVQKSTNLLHDSEFCAWKQMLHPGEKCNCTTATAPELSFDGCELAPVTPKPYDKKDFGLYRDSLSASVVPYLNAARAVVMETCHLVAVFVAVLVLVDLLGAVVWIYFKRFNLLRLKPMFEVEHFPVPTANHS